MMKGNHNEELERNVYLRNLATGKLVGPMTGYSSKDKPWLKYYEEASLYEDLPENITVYDYMKNKNLENSNRIALNYYGNIYTFGDLFKKVDEYASRFKSLGVQKGDIVSVCMPSTPETVFAIYALNKLGAICDMIDPRSNAEQMKYYLGENKSKLLILCENYYKVMKPAIDVANLDKTLLFPITPSAPLAMKLLIDTKVKLDNKNVEFPANVLRWNDFINIDKSISMETEYNDSDLAFIVHSSGTTSVPKGIMLTNKNINAIALQYSLTTLDLNPGDKFLSVIPAFASFGVVASINLPLYLSMETILVPLPSPKAFVKLVTKEKPNFCLTIPANFVYLKNHYKGKDLSHFSGPGCGGYSLDSSQEREINEFLKAKNAPSPMLMGWGMSELASTACLEVPECSKELSSGIPLIKNVISIFEPDTDRELQYGEEGEICVSGPTIMYGYLNNPEKTNMTIKRHSDGSIWLHSHDIGYMDSDGRVYPIDRIDRMIIKGIDGFKIYPQKVEDVISSSKCVDASVVVGCEGPNGIYPKAFVVLKREYENNKEALEEIKRICLEKLSVRAVPDEFEFVEKLPYTAMGKIDYRKLEENSSKIEEKQKMSGIKKILRRR